MEIILKQDVNNLGMRDDVVTVKDGYAQNFLIPKGYAIVATPSAKKILNENIKQRAHKEARVKAAAAELAAKMEGVKLQIGAKTSTTGKIFGSVNSIQIAEALAEKGFEIERKNVILSDDAIKEIGTYNATIKLHREVSVAIEIEVVSE